MRCLRLVAAVIGVLLLSVLALAQSFSRANYAVSSGTRLDRADMNGDGKPDIFVWSDSIGLKVLLNNGSGGFGPAISTSIPGLSSAQLGDFNNDRKLDAAACEFSNGAWSIHIWLGDGAGHFIASGQVSSPSCTRFAVGDFNRDGRPDVAVVEPVGPGVDFNEGVTSNNVIVELGNGSGGFNGAITTTGLGSGTSNVTDGVCAFYGPWGGADLNRDGWPDLVTGEDCSGDVTDGGTATLINDGTGHFRYARISDLALAQNVRFRDVNQDGWLDLLVESDYNYPHGGHRESADVLMSQGGPSYSLDQVMNERGGDGDPTCGAVNGFDSADMSGDGNKDLAVGDYHDDDCIDGTGSDQYSLRVFYAPANGDYSALASPAVVTTDSLPLDIVWGDFDRDGRPDFAMLKNNGNVEVFLNRDANAPICSAASAGLRTVTLCRPSESATLTTPSRILANITTGNPVTGLKIYIDGSSKFVGYDDLVNKFLSLGAGSHKVTVKAWDAQGPFSTSHYFSVSGTSSGGGGGTCTASSTSRSVHICSPLNGSTVSSPVQVSAAVNDSKSVTVKIYVDGVSKFSTTSKQVSWSTTLSAGSHHITVKAWDSSGSFSSASSFTVK